MARKKKKAKKRGIKTDFFPLALEEFQDYVISFLDRRTRHYTLSHTINYCGRLEYNPKVVRFIQQYPEEFGNLFNDSWWRNQHNEEEVEMRKHPNRSSQWIGNRLEKERTDLIIDLFQNLRSITEIFSKNQEIKLCALCGTDLSIADETGSLTPNINGFCSECWDTYAFPYLQEFIAYSLDSNPN